MRFCRFGLVEKFGSAHSVWLKNWVPLIRFGWKMGFRSFGLVGKWGSAHSVWLKNWVPLIRFGWKMGSRSFGLVGKLAFAHLLASVMWHILKQRMLLLSSCRLCFLSIIKFTEN